MNVLSSSTSPQARATRVRRPSRDEVRRRLLDAAADCLAAHGYAGATVEAITEAAGLSRGALYSNFADRDELFVELLDRIEAEQVAELTEMGADAGGDLAGFLAALGARSPGGRLDVPTATALHAELCLLATRRPEVRSRMAAIARRNRDALVDALVAGGLRPDIDPVLAATTVLAVVDGNAQQRLVDDAAPGAALVDVLALLGSLTGLLPTTDPPR